MNQVRTGSDSFVPSRDVAGRDLTYTGQAATFIKVCSSDSNGIVSTCYMCLKDANKPACFNMAVIKDMFDMEEDFNSALYPLQL